MESDVNLIKSFENRNGNRETKRPKYRTYINAYVNIY